MEPRASSFHPPAHAAQRVIYVDDEDALVQVGTRMLQRLGYLVQGFSSAEEALESFRADPEHVDMVVTDVSMPRMSGLDLARELLALRHDTCIVLTSGYVDSDLLARARDVGVQHVLYKANTMKELCDNLHRVMQGQKSPSRDTDK